MSLGPAQSSASLSALILLESVAKTLDQPYKINSKPNAHALDMTQRVDFYLLDQQAPIDIARYGCRLLNKVYSAGLRAFVLAQSDEQACLINQLLWVLSDANFIPHALEDSVEAQSNLTKICIGTTLPDNAGFDYLLCFSTDARIQGEQFERVAELVSADEDQKAFARKRYASWRNRGADLNLHRIQLH